MPYQALPSHASLSNRFYFPAFSELPASEDLDNAYYVEQANGAPASLQRMQAFVINMLQKSADRDLHAKCMYLRDGDMHAVCQMEGRMHLAASAGAMVALPCTGA